MRRKIFFIVFMVIWISLIIINFLLPKKVFSEQENRYLASIPDFNFDDLVNGEYIEELDNYINDHFAFRDFWLKLNSLVQISTGKTENNGVYIGKDGYLFEKFEYTGAQKENVKMAEKAINDLLIFFAGSRLGSNGFVPAFVLYLGQTEAGVSVWGRKRGWGGHSTRWLRPMKKQRKNAERMPGCSSCPMGAPLCQR